MSSNAISAGQRVHVPETVRGTVDRLVALSVNGLVRMFDPAEKLFCFTLKQTDQGLTRQGISRRYTMMALMGLHRLEQSGTKSPIEIQPVFEGLLAQTDWIDNIGDLGLLLWLCSLVSPQRLQELEDRVKIKNALTRFRGARHGHTMELAWLLTGLSHGILSGGPARTGNRELAVEIYRLLVQNQGDHGTFGHASTNQSFAGFLRGRIGSFADQVYPIYALTKFSQALGDERALERALDCSLNICEAQGALGQWWWHYDSSTGEVAGKYPVFSVHQHAMGPMTLFAVGQATNSDFAPWIYRGLEWIGKNELGFDMEDASANLVWRCVHQPAAVKYLGLAKQLLTGRHETSSRKGLAVRFECRPYELGWLLYAFANTERSPVKSDPPCPRRDSPKSFSGASR